jgi:hypothetical protein
MKMETGVITLGISASPEMAPLAGSGVCNRCRSEIEAGSFVFLCVLLSLFVFAGCGRDNKELTVAEAQRALNKFTEGRGKISVLGVQAGPGFGGMTMVDVTFTGFTDPKADRSSPYSGPGMAGFVRYTDGRWILRTIAPQDGRFPIDANVIAE